MSFSFRRLAASCGIVALVAAAGPLLPRVQAAPAAPADPTITFSLSRVRPGESVTLSYAGLSNERPVIICIWADGALMTCAPPPFGNSSTTYTYDELVAGFEGAHVVRMAFFAPDDIADMEDVETATPVSDASLRIAATPAAPSIVSLTRGDRRVAVVSAPNATTYGPAVLGYQTRCTPAPGTDTSTSTESATTSTTVRGLPVKALVECSSRARNSQGWSIWGPTMRIKTSGRPPAAPTAALLRSVTAGPASATVRLGEPENPNGGTITGYQARCVNGTTTVMSTASSSGVHVVAGLTANVAWTCSGRARNTVGWGDWSTTSTVTPTAAPV